MILKVEVKGGSEVANRSIKQQLKNAMRQLEGYNSAYHQPCNITVEWEK